MMGVVPEGEWLLRLLKLSFRSHIVLLQPMLPIYHLGERFGFGHVAVASAASYILGAKIHSGRVTKKLKKKHQQDQKTLYTQYYNDVYKLEEQKLEQKMIIQGLEKALQNTNEQHEMENLQREYDEFKHLKFIHQ